MAVQVRPVLPSLNDAGKQLQVQVPQPGFRSSVSVNGEFFPFQSEVVWGYTSGVAPQRLRFRLVPEQAERLVQLASQGEALELEWSGTNSIGEDVPPQTFTGLSIMPVEPNEVLTDEVEVVDQRWRWPKAKVTKTYNLVRKTNDILAFDQGTSALQVSLNRAKNYYVPWTIKQDEAGNPTEPFSALDIVIDILVNTLGYSEEQISFNRAATSIYIPPNQVLVGVAADTALSQYLDLSDNSLYLDNDGNIVIYASRIPFGVAEFTAWGAGAVNSRRVAGNMFVIDQRSIRPSAIYIGNEIEQEFLMQYTEQERPRTSVRSTGGGLTQEAVENFISENFLYLENVTRTIVNEQVPGLPAGTIVTIDEALAAFGSQYGSGPISHEDIRETYGATDSSYLISSLLGGSEEGEAAIDPIAGAVLGQILNDYRTLFRIPIEIMERIKDLVPYMVDIISPEHRLRVPSEVYTKLTWFINMNARVLSQGKKPEGATLNSFDGKNPFEPTAARISIEDKDLGLIRMTLAQHQNLPGVFSRMLPGELPDDLAANLNDEGWYRGVVEPLGTNLPHGLKADWEMTAVVSVVLLTPNNSSRLHWEKVEAPSEFGESNGPPVNVVHRHDTFRLRLPDQWSSYISASRQSNRREVNKNIIRLLAEQEAYRRYVTFLDQLVGQVSMSWDEGTVALRPAGPIGTVKFRRTVDGGMYVDAGASLVTDGPDLRNLLPDEVLQVVFQQLNLSESAQGGRT